MKWPRLFRGSSSRRITFENPFIIRAPRIAFLNLAGPLALAILNADKATLSPLFAHSEESDRDPPRCDVLMVYCHLLDDGSINGSSYGLRDLMRASRASIVIVASENKVESYIAANKHRGDERANLVMALGRRGNAFATFFTRLFQKMSQGKTMPLAWVELAPQAPQADHQDCPEAIFSAEISHIVFR